MSSKSPAPGTSAPAPGRLRKFIDSYMAAWNDHESAAMVPLVTEYVIWTDPALPEPARGPAAVQKFMEDSWRAFPDLRFEEAGPVCTNPDSPVVTLPWRMLGTNRGAIDPPGFAATGKRLDIEGIDVWEFSGERIARYRAYYDMTDLARQLGIAPAPGSRAEQAAVRLQRLQTKANRRLGR